MDNVNDLARQFLRGKMHALEFKRAMIKELQGSVGSCELLLCAGRALALGFMSPLLLPKAAL
jgi:hypothetical protein